MWAGCLNALSRFAQLVKYPHEIRGSDGIKQCFFYFFTTWLKRKLQLTFKMWGGRVFLVTYGTQWQRLIKGCFTFFSCTSVTNVQDASAAARSGRSGLPQYFMSVCEGVYARMCVQRCVQHSLDWAAPISHSFTIDSIKPIISHLSLFAVCGCILFFLCLHGD